MNDFVSHQDPLLTHASSNVCAAYLVPVGSGDIRSGNISSGSGSGSKAAVEGEEVIDITGVCVCVRVYLVCVMCIYVCMH